MTLRAKLLAVGFAAVLSVYGAACSRISVPSLEDASCREARDNVKRFYSLHFDGSLAPSVDDLNRKRRFLTPGLFQSLMSRTDVSEDYFTGTSDYPRAFRVGTCTSESTDRVRFDVRLFWRDDNRSEEREVTVTMARSDGSWLFEQVVRKQ